MDITREGDNLVLKVPLYQKENNCYMDDKDLEMTDNLVGIVAGNDFTISHLNDLSYKGDKQEGFPIITFSTKEELEEVCKRFHINVWVIPVCKECNKVMRGSFTWGDKGETCFDCAKK